MPGYKCSLCDTDEPAVILITPLTGGETMPVGNDCLPTALTGMLAGTVGIDGDKLWAAVERLLKAAKVSADIVAEESPRTRPAGRRRAAGAAAPPGPPADPPGRDQDVDMAYLAAQGGAQAGGDDQ
jgi:hypothetical protein